ncbi:MAG: hypothetical protein ACE5HV_13595, partial [Acidobacteriota bacterium]
AAAAVAARIPGLQAVWLRAAAQALVDRYKQGNAGPGHFLGTSLSSHDDAVSPLQAGQVMAYEMVLSAPEKELRVTLEDVVAVTTDGFEILSEGLPTTVEEVERLVGAEATPPPTERHLGPSNP